MRTNVAAALRRLGIGDAATRVYVELLERSPAPLDVIGKAVGLSGERLLSVYGELVDAGLAGAAAGVRDLAAPVPPAASLQVLRRHRAAELDEFGIAVTGAFDTFRRARLAAHHADVVELVTGEEIGPRVRQAWQSAELRIRQFDSPPYFPLAGGGDAALATLRRGVVQRVVYSRASLEVPGNLVRNIEPCLAAGEQARVLPSLPVKLLIIDDAYALVSLSIQEAEVHNTMLVVQPCGLFSALVALFEQTWQNALPFHGHVPRPHRLVPADRRLLALLAAGVPDEEIARNLGISRRTLSRRVETHMNRLGATTRFQMALQAQHRGWL
ncbi:helix-turn-helix transcriptional regulator [Streptomyces sp. NPDC047974]|uniref:helix-turn-helix transcriptional regulator n=1 Tax=Streptomyces sp. NPDC047974 TaxID=3154343 RepID=UPI0033DB72CC